MGRVVLHGLLSCAPSPMRCGWLTALILGAVGWPSVEAPASGQTASTRGPAVASMPMALPLGRVPLGTWAEYRMADGTRGNLSFKMVLVAREGKVCDLETIIEGGAMAPIGRVVMRSSIHGDSGADATPERHIVQLGDNPPMSIPMRIAGGPSQEFRKPDPRNRLGVESVTVAAGTYPRAEHYQERMASGDKVDTWVSKDVPPFGLVKLQGGVDPQGRPLLMELVKQGTGGKPVITAPCQPYDPAVLAKQLKPLIAAQQAAATASAAAERHAPMR